MAGIAKPNVDNLRKEGNIDIIEENTTLSGNESPLTLFDGDINKKTYTGVTLSQDLYFIFELHQRSNIWAYGQKYSDSGGSTPKLSNLYKKIKDNFELIKSNIATKDDDTWYLLLKNLDKGIYKISGVNSYVMFTEWYVEDINPYKYLIKQNNQYYTIKSDFCKNGNYESISELEGGEILTETDFETYGIDDLNLLTETIDTQVINEINKGNLGSGKLFETPFSNDFLSINEVK